MKKFSLLFLIVLAFLFNTCKKENIEKELPWLIGKWHYYGSSISEYCYTRSGSQTYYYDYYLDTIINMKNNFGIDANFSVEFKKKIINIIHNGIHYEAFVFNDSASYIESISRYQTVGLENNYLGYNNKNMEYMPKCSDIEVKTEILLLNFNYKNTSFSSEKDPVMIKKIIANDSLGVRKEFLQLFFSNILNNNMLYSKEYIQYSNFTCGYSSLIILTLVKE